VCLVVIVSFRPKRSVHVLWLMEMELSYTAVLQ
jgi:hypothetical protein